MRYFLVISGVTDGEYEYWRRVPVEAADSEEAAVKGLADDQEWVKADYRIVSCEGVQEIPAEDYAVLKKYL